MLATIGMGHNSAGYGQMLKPAKPVAPKPPKQRFPYFKFYPRDWLEATREMSLEQRGAYIDLICIIMEMEGHLADNDAWISHQMHVSTRKWKAMKKQLVGHEKIRIEDGKIVNERCLKELDSLLTQRRNIAESASNRERTKREKPEKPNENNDTDTTIVPLRALASDLDSDKEKKKEDSVPDGTGPDGPPAKTLREMVWDEAIAWLRPLALTPEAKLRTRIGGWMRDYGEAAVLDAVAKAQDKRPVSPMSYIEGILRNSGAKPGLPPWEIAEAEKQKREEAAIEQMREYQLQRQRERERVK